jgi:hypothetical protein
MRKNENEKMKNDKNEKLRKNGTGRSGSRSFLL